eukprot:GEMP01042989.1.p1 GENE.GEMP01042989.1~~GEMP01042989.1.p1  ORF type:complete len:292 (+),score=64.71 GEMP01042989.1:76-951(+)
MVESIVQTPSPILGSSVAGDVADILVSNLMADAAAFDKNSLLSELSSVKAELEVARLELESYRHSKMQAGKSQKTGKKDEVALSNCETQAKLEAAYEQIAILNTQMAHLYTELTFARTGSHRSNPVPDQSKFETDLYKRSEQIGVLVQDIRHLQSDLEYHQERMTDLRTQRDEESGKVDALREEKESLLVKLEDAEQQLKHLAIDRSYLDSVKKDDPAHFVYDIQRERSLREREERKCARLSERLQKALLTVESQKQKILIAEKQMQKILRMGKLTREKRNLPIITPRMNR